MQGAQATAQRPGGLLGRHRRQRAVAPARCASSARTPCTRSPQQAGIPEDEAADVLAAVVPRSSTGSPPTARSRRTRRSTTSSRPRRASGAETELAAGDDDRRAADLDGVDEAVSARRARGASRGGRSRRPARSRSPRPTRRARAARGGTRSGLPPSRSQGSSRRAPRTSGSASRPSRAKTLTPVTSSARSPRRRAGGRRARRRRRERDEDVLRAVVVELDGQRRARRAERREHRLGILDRLDARHRLRHAAEHDPPRTRRARARPARSRRRSPARSRRAGAARRARTPHRASDGPRTASPTAGLKIRIRAVPPCSGGSTKTVSEKPISRASACIVASSSRRARR